MHESWKQRLSGEFTKPYFKQLTEFIREERAQQMVFPEAQNVFNAYQVPYGDVKVLILGQDPYHGAGQAHGMSFSVLPGIKPPPSLQNIFKELKSDLDLPIPKTGYLLPWAQQGVQLLNATLTVRAHEAGSHQGKGWETFTDETIRLLSGRSEPLVFVLWGRYARDKRHLIDSRHTIVESAHPSPMSAANGFFGSKPFSKVNAALEGYGIQPIDWSL